ncbi:hypothetical protein [Alkalibacillus silvisoli]|uniref:Uncharacterized protein n=1 Tax=Alkalibacillus silvisoli TaxID=392823 RepID=A0ABP3JHH1_9BACI
MTRARKFAQLILAFLLLIFPYLFEMELHAPILYYIVIIPVVLFIVVAIIFDDYFEGKRKQIWYKIRKWKKWQGLLWYSVLNIFFVKIITFLFQYIIDGVTPTMIFVEASIQAMLFLSIFILLLSFVIGVLTYSRNGEKYGYKTFDEAMNK